MRVLLVSQYFWPEQFRINDVVRSLVERGVEVDVLTGKPNYPEGSIYPGYSAAGTQTEKSNGATLFRVPLLPRGRGRAWQLAMNYLSFVLSGLAFGPWLVRKRRYDVVFAYGLSPILQVIPAILLARLHGCKLVVWVQDLWPESLSATGHVRNSLVLRLVGHVVAWIYRRCDLILVQSEAFVAPVRKLAGQVPIRYYPNSVDPAFAQPLDGAAPVSDVPAMQDGFVVMFAGNVGAAQAVETILDAATLLREHPVVRFVVFGNGSRWSWLRDQVASRGLGNLHLPGQFPVSAMPGLMRQAGALLVTLADKPIFAATVPNKVQAYLASARPIVACLNGEGARIVEEAGAGLSVPAENAKALAAAVVKIYEMSAEQRNQLGENGLAYFNANFDHDRLVGTLVEHLTAQSKRSST